MANIVELREMSDDKLEELLENAREEMFNLRFQKASARLENTTRIREVRREIAQFETVLNMRQQAIAAAAADPAVQNVLGGTNWSGNARYIYEDAAWQVELFDESGNSVATAMVNLNKKRPTKKQARKKGLPQRVSNVQVAG
jgi:large subunit ribosomal protein L29